MRHAQREKLICDLTQSYAPVGGGGVSTYLRKSAHILERPIIA
jgi:hypothetical protein